MFANTRNVQNDKLLKDLDAQTKEIKGLCVANGTLKEKLSSLRQDTNLQLKTVRTLVRY